MKSHFKILDCTFRDGGYYNNWDFDKKIIENYIDSIISSKVDFVEIGFRNFPQNKFLGPFAYSTDNFIKNLPSIDKINVGVMSDASIFLDGSKISNNVKKLYSSKRESPISLVRIATHFKDIEQSRDIIETLKELGYMVGLNLMQSGGKSEQQIENAVKKIAKWNNVDVLYFADSLGNMDEKEVVKITKLIKTNWDKDLGIHTHNNKGQALNNSIAALNNGISWIDGTVSGMGRGAGNASTEDLLREVNKITGSDFMILATGILFGAYGNTWRVNKLNKLGYIYSDSVNAQNYKIALNNYRAKAPITGKEPSTKTKENKYTSSPGVLIDSEGIPTKIKAESSISKEENQENAASKERPKETKKSKNPISDDDSEYASKLKEAKSLLNDELINKADYEKIKKKIIDNL